MANTGTKIVLTLQEVEVPGDIPTGNTKPNTVGDPDYIAPYEDLVDCPIPVDFACPTMAVTGLAGVVQYEIFVANSVLANPNAAKTRIRVMDSGGTVEQAFVIVNLPYTPEANYSSGAITGVPAGTHQISVQYLNSSNVVQSTCNSIITGLVTT